MLFPLLDSSCVHTSAGYALGFCLSVLQCQGGATTDVHLYSINIQPNVLPACLSSDKFEEQHLLDSSGGHITGNL